MTQQSLRSLVLTLVVLSIFSVIAYDAFFVVLGKIL